MIAVADSSPLIILANLAAWISSIEFFRSFIFSKEVHHETVVRGAGLPGAAEVSNAGWIEVRSLQNPSTLHAVQRNHGLGPGEMSTILLAKELGVNPVLLDDHSACNLAKAEGLQILGSVGLLETFYLRQYLPDLRGVFGQLLIHNVYR